MTTPYLHMHEDITNTPSNKNFKLHTHDDYEIFLFLSGNSEYVVDGHTYDLEPYDIIIIKKNELHRIFHKSSAVYHRIVLNVSLDFFTDYNCPEYEAPFLNSGSGNKILAKTVLSSGLYDAFMRLRKYSNNYTQLSTPIAVGIVTEILYLINNINDFSNANNKNKVFQSVITYINNSYTENITLEDLERKFFISKYHLCRIFRKATGLTVHQYITRKRLALAKELVKHGKNISEASYDAGFNSYSSFYRAYIREYGNTPKLSTHS